MSYSKQFENVIKKYLDDSQHQTNYLQKNIKILIRTFQIAVRSLLVK